MKIRSYRQADYKELKNLLELCSLFDKSYDTEEKLKNKKPEGSIIVAEDGDEIVGCIFFTWDGWDSSIYRLAVHSDYRKEGLGSKLLEEAENRLKSIGADVVSLRVHVDNKDAEEFFRRRGYSGNWGPYWDIEKKL